jgi:phytoene synthase
MADHDYCERLVKEADKDRFLAALFAPQDKRPHLHALYAFCVEISRVREVVSEPLPGEIRLQWWRDLLEGEARGDAQSHPTAAAVLDVIARYNLPRRAFLDLIEARVFDLYDDPMPTVHDLEGYAGETASSVIQLAALILNDGVDPQTADISGHAGVAQSITGLLRAFPLHASRRQLFVPVEVLDRHEVRTESIFAGQTTPELLAALAEMRAHARRHLERAARLIDEVPGNVIAAFLPVALVRGYLARMDRPDYDPFTTPVQVPQWKRQWVLWQAARRAAKLAHKLEQRDTSAYEQTRGAAE